MRTLYFTQEGNQIYNNKVLVDFSNNKVTSCPVDEERWNIKSCFATDEDVEIRYDYKGKTHVKKAQKGDIIIIFDDRDLLDPVIVVKNTEWRNNIINKKAIREANRAKDTVNAEYCDCACENTTCCDGCNMCLKGKC